MKNFRTHHLVIISMLVFIVLNIVENYLHYNLGRNAESVDKFKINLPSTDDWIHIGIIMIIFAFIQGELTEFFSNIIN